MKIGILAYVLTRKYSDGIKTYLYNIIKELEKIDNDNEYFIYTPYKIELPFNHNPRWHVRICEGFINKSGTLWQFFNAKKYLLRDKVEVFWATENLLPNSFREFSIRTILTIHDVMPYVYPERLDFVNFIFFKLFGKRTIRNADLIVTVSNATKDKLKALNGNNIKKIEVIYNGVDIAVFKIYDKNECREYCSRKFNISKDYIFTVSVLKPTKNLEGLLKAFRIFKNKYGRNLQLVIVGGCTSRYPLILKTFRRLHFRDNEVRFLGSVDIEDLVKLYNSAVLFITLPIDEGFGLPVLEAITCGIPVICSDIPALREISGDIATFVDYNDYKKIAYNIEEVCTYKKDVVDYSISNKIAQRFSWNRTAEKIKGIFKDVHQ